MIDKKMDELAQKISSPVPFWFINGPCARWQIEKEFEMMHDKGVTEVIVHPRYGLDVEYLSDGWFEIFGWCVEEAKKRNMYLWIYDELNWPSGTAGMSIMRDYPDFRSKYLAVEETPLKDISLEDFELGTYTVAAKFAGGTVLETKRVASKDEIAALADDWHIFNCKKGYDDFYVDTLSKEAIDKFKEVTYDAYYSRFGEEFGKTIRAVFTDEPSIYWVSVGYDDWNLPYTDDFMETFEERYGYDAVEKIPCLFHEGRDYNKHRVDYYRHASDLFNSRYHANLGGWCREHGVIYTGHNNNEEPLRYQVRFQGDMMGTMRLMDVPGVDHLGKQTLGNALNSIIGHKICSSETHIAGKSRCMSESFGVMDWDTTYLNLKKVVDWQYGLGINMMVPHAIFHTISGMTKRESPPSFFYQSPHWDDFGYFSEYLQRLEEMLCGGIHSCRVAVLYPKRGLWATYQTDRKTPEFEHTDNFLNSLCVEFMKAQVDFDFIDIERLMESEIKDGGIIAEEKIYEYLVIPSESYLDEDKMGMLKRIASGGVNTTVFYRTVDPMPESLPSELKGVAFMASSEIEAFADVLKTEIDYGIHLTGGGADDILAYRRMKGRQKITFLVNRSDKHRKVTAILRDFPNAAIFCPETGKYTDLGVGDSTHKTQVQLRFEPYESYFIVSEVEEAEKEAGHPGEPTQIYLSGLQATTPFNVAAVYNYQFTGKDGTTEKVDVRKGPRYIPANWTPNPPDFTQFAGSYESRIELDCSPEGIIVLADGDFADCEVYINDILVEFAPCCTGTDVTNKELRDGFYLTDFMDLRADGSGLLKKGMNDIKIVSPTKLSEPLRFVGDFCVDISPEVLNMYQPDTIKPLDMVETHPYYSGTVYYAGKLTLEETFGAVELDLQDVYDTACVRVNGAEVGKRLWPPYRLDITKFVSVGENTVEIEVRNNASNLIVGNVRKLGLVKKPRVFVY